MGRPLRAAGMSSAIFRARDWWDWGNRDERGQVWQRPSSPAAELVEPSLQERPLGALPGQFQRAPVSRAGLVRPPQPTQQIGAGRVGEAVAAEGAGGERVDQ